MNNRKKWRLLTDPGPNATARLTAPPVLPVRHGASVPIPRPHNNDKLRMQFAEMRAHGAAEPSMPDMSALGSLPSLEIDLAPRPSFPRTLSASSHPLHSRDTRHNSYTSILDPTFFIDTSLPGPVYTPVLHTMDADDSSRTFMFAAASFSDRIPFYESPSSVSLPCVT